LRDKTKKTAYVFDIAVQHFINLPIFLPPHTTFLPDLRSLPMVHRNLTSIKFLRGLMATANKHRSRQHNRDRAASTAIRLGTRNGIRNPKSNQVVIRQSCRTPLHRRQSSLRSPRGSREGTARKRANEPHKSSLQIANPNTPPK
jgi:hypothetical protein